MKQKILSALIGALVLGTTAAANATVTVTIDPDGAGGDAAIAVGALDWAVGNSIAVANSGETLAGGFTRPGQTLTTYAWSGLNAFQDSGGNGIGGTRLNFAGAGGYEWTFVTGFRETISGITVDGTGAVTTNNIVNNAATNFFEIYYHPARNRSNLGGTGFEDGTLILAANGLAAGASGTGTFTANGGPANLDASANGNQYQFGAPATSYRTVTGNGSTTIGASVTFINPLFFPGLNTGDLIRLSFGSDQRLNYNQTDPSSCYWNGSAYALAAGNGIGGAGNRCGSTVGDGGSIGLLNGLTGPNVMFQTDAAMSFTVPEPGSLALLGVAVVGLAWGSRRKAAAAE